jgi:hypothetical protein
MEKKEREELQKEIISNRPQRVVYRRGEEYSESDIFLAVLWFNGIIGFADVKRSMDNTTNVYSFLSLALKDGLRKGIVKLDEIEEKLSKLKE